MGDNNVMTREKRKEIRDREREVHTIEGKGGGGGGGGRRRRRRTTK